MKPFEQLLNVLPPQSSYLLPKSYQFLMNDMEKSPIIFNYPTQISTQNFMKFYFHETKTRLPIIDQDELKDAIKDLKLTKEEEERNKIQEIFIKEKVI